MNAPAIGAIVEYQYDLLLVALSFLISVMGSYVALSLAVGRGKQRDRAVGPAIALGGCAVWAMHFIGMAAYKTALPVSYDMLPTLVSLVIAIAITWAGFKLAARGPQHLGNLLIGGVVIGAGVVAMHYLGMFGINMRATLQWNVPLVAASVVIAVVAATVALWLAFNVKTTAQRALSAVVMGVAVCAMHYTGMAAATLVCVASATRGEFSLDGPHLAYFVFMIAIVALAYSVVHDFVTRPMQAQRAA